MPESIGIERPIWPHTTLRAETGRELSVPQLTDSLVEEFAGALPIFLSDGFAPFQSEYESLSVLLGRRIRFRDGSRTVTGVATGITHDGQLLVQEEDGNGAVVPGGPKGFLSGEVSGVEVVEPTGAVFVEGVDDGKG